MATKSTHEETTEKCGTFSPPPALPADGQVIWGHANPDFDLVVQPLSVSINKNWLTFGNKENRPPSKHSICITNHSDTPVAFKVSTTDNVSYFVSQKTGVIGGRRLAPLPFIRSDNFVHLIVYRRPSSCFSQTTPLNHHCTRRKDVLEIAVAPALSFSLPPRAHFHHSQPFSFLRVCLEYTGLPQNKDTDQSYMWSEYKYWNTWTRPGKTGKEKEKGKDKAFECPCLRHSKTASKTTPE